MCTAVVLLLVFRDIFSATLYNVPGVNLTPDGFFFFFNKKEDKEREKNIFQLAVLTAFWKGIQGGKEELVQPDSSSCSTLCCPCLAMSGVGLWGSFL